MYFLLRKDRSLSASSQNYSIRLYSSSCIHFTNSPIKWWNKTIRLLYNPSKMIRLSLYLSNHSVFPHSTVYCIIHSYRSTTYRIWQSNSPLYSQGRFDLWWNPNFHCRVQKSTMVIPLFIWVSLVHHFTSVPSVSPLALPPVRVYVSRQSIQVVCPRILFFFTRVTVSYKVCTLLSWAAIAQ